MVQPGSKNLGNKIMYGNKVPTSGWLDVQPRDAPPGIYKIRIPDNPHDGRATEFYRKNEEPDLRNDQVWFPIEYGDNSRYIHVGHLSHGCVTVMQLEKWNALYQALIEHRMSGGNYVGQLLVSR